MIESYNENMEDFIEGEIWKEIEGFPWYEISNKGRLRSWNWQNGHVGAGGEKKSQKPLILKLHNNASGYKIKTIKNRTFQIHRLVLEAFVGPCPLGKMCDHKDRNKSNNCVENLHWVTAKENAQNRNCRK